MTTLPDDIKVRSTETTFCTLPHNHMKRNGLILLTFFHSPISCHPHVIEWLKW